MSIKKAEWPKTISCGNSSVRVYKGVNGSGGLRFRIKYVGMDGKAKEESETDETLALSRAKKKAETLSTFGARAASVMPGDMAELVRLSDLVKPFSVSLTATVERTVGWLARFTSLDAIERALTAGPVVCGDGIVRSVAGVVTEFLELKCSNGAAQSYKDTLKSVLKKFSTHFQVDLATVTTAQIQTWLDGQKLHAATQNNLRRVLHLFFAYCLRRGYCSVNPVKHVEQRKEKQGNAEIYTPAELQTLLVHADDALKLRLVISAFAGLRTAEFGRLTWANVDFEGGNIILDAGQAKTASRRVIPMPANLRAWLQPHKDKKGKIWPGTGSTLITAQQHCAQAAGMTWKDNALRHSFCSYRLAITQDAAKVAFEAGNSAPMIHRHYKALVTEAQAKEWFAIMPN